MALGKFPEPGRPTICIPVYVGQGPTVLTVGAGGGCLDIFTLIYPFSPLSPSLWETARYRLKYCLKGPFNPKQPTNEPDSTLPITKTDTNKDAQVTKIALPVSFFISFFFFFCTGTGKLSSKGQVKIFIQVQ